MKINFSTAAQKIVLSLIWFCFIIIGTLIFYLTYRQHNETVIIWFWVFFAITVLLLSVLTIYCWGYYRITSRRITKCWLGGLYRKEYYYSDFEYIGRCLREENILSRFDVKYEGEYFDNYKSDNIFFLFSLYPKGEIPKRSLKKALHMLYSVDPIGYSYLEGSIFLVSVLLAYCPRIGDSKVIALPYSEPLVEMLKNVKYTSK